MKKIVFLLILCLILQIFTFDKIAVHADNVSEIVIDFSSGRVLYSYNANEKKAIASTTKILTAITAIENYDIAKEVTIKSEWCGIEGSSIYLKEGEKYSIEQLLYGLMLRSGNDSAVAIANAVGGSETEFVKLMNQTAKNADALNSSFSNPHGLDNVNHFSTAEDLAKITRYALNNETFKKIVSSKAFTFEREGERVTWVNKNKLLANYENAIGVKTGYTKKAGRCLVSASEKNGQILICVVLNCSPMYERSEALLEKCYGEYCYCKLLSSENCVAVMPLKNGKGIPCYVEEDILYPLLEEEKESIEYIVRFDEKINFPVKFHQKVGTIQIWLKKQLLFERKIYTIL